MKRAATVFLVLVAAGLLLVSCGGGTSSTTTPTVSGIKLRAFVTNSFSSIIQIIDAAQDAESFFTIPSAGSFVPLGVNPTFVVLSADKKSTLVYSAGDKSVRIVDNVAEDVTGSIAGLPDWSESIVLSPDAKSAWAAVRNAPVTGQPTGAVQVLDIAKLDIASQIPVPLVHWLVLSHDGKKLLAFSDQSDAVTIIDTATNAVVTAVTGFDRPVAAVFSADDTKAYVLSCGAECGGTTANVRLLDMATNTPGASVAVSGATVGLLDGSNLYVAGTTPAGGRLDVINTSNLTAVKAGVPIGDGYHTLMSLASSGKLFVGARACTNQSSVPNSGCLSIFNTSAQTAAVPAVDCTATAAQTAQCGDVTGVQPITGRNVVYVVEGGELVIYDTTTDAPQSKQIDIVGKAYDVKLVD